MMFKYLPMENATFELEFDNEEQYEEFFEHYYKEISRLGLKRIIININQNDIVKLYKKLINILDDENILVIFKVLLNGNFNIELKENFIINNLNSEKIFNKSYIYNLININEREKIVKFVNEGVNVIVNPEVDINNIKKFNDNLFYIINNIIDKNLNLDGYILPTYLLREHPCNAYLCKGWNCHKKITGLPRNIYINKNFNVYPHKLLYDKLCMGNILNNSFQQLFESYLKSDEYDNFIKYNKMFFIDILKNYPYDYIPIIDFIKWGIENDK